MPKTSAKVTDTIAILDEVDNRLLAVALAAAALIDTHTYPVTTIAKPTPGELMIAAPTQSERWLFHAPCNKRELRVVILISAVLAALSLAWIGGAEFYQPIRREDDLTGNAAIDHVVERIIDVESNGDANAKNRRSSATGSGQFLDETWLELIRRARPDLASGRSKKDILGLRENPKLVREITSRLAQQNAATLSQRGLPVTAGTLYLSHFAGAAGAVAILRAPDTADAALVMANADASGRTTRGQLIKANPFLERFTAADLRNWAERQMRSSNSTGSKAGDAQ